MRHRVIWRTVGIGLAVGTVSALSRHVGLFSLDYPRGTKSLNRKSLLALVGLGAGTLATGAWRNRSLVAQFSGGSRAGAVGCLLAPEQTEGPYYIAREKVRSNIVENRPGMPMTLKLAVVDAATCAAIKGAAVDIWHCDATGIYSGFVSASTSSNGPGSGGPGGSGAGPGGGNGGHGPGGAGGPSAGSPLPAGGPSGNSPGGVNRPTDKRTFLRGIQFTDAHGFVTFQTIYPGWYTGRTTHIHIKVHVGGNVIHTGQLYFPDSLTDQVYQTGVYKARAAQRDTRNATDSIYSNGGSQSTLTLTRATIHGKQGYTAAITLGVHRG